MKLIHALTATLALAAALPAHADFQCYPYAPAEVGALQVKTNADLTASAVLTKDGEVVANYSGTYTVKKTPTEMPSRTGAFKDLHFALHDEAGQPATLQIAFEKIWSLGGGFCGRGSCVPKEVTEVTGVLTSSTLTQKFECYETVAND